MIKAVFCIRRLPRMEAGQFKDLIERIYRADLKQIAKGYGAATTTLYRRGDQSSAAECYSATQDNELDAILELSWQDDQSFRDAVESTRPRGGLGLIFAKLGHIADLTRSHYMVLNRSVSSR